MIGTKRLFQIPYEQYKYLNGRKCLVLRELTDNERDPEVGPMYRVKFAHGEEIDAWPEELEKEAKNDDHTKRND